MWACTEHCIKHSDDHSEHIFYFSSCIGTHLQAQALTLLEAEAQMRMLYISNLLQKEAY